MTTSDRAHERSLLRFYARALRQVFHGVTLADSPTVFLVASALHSFAHAALAVAAGRCAVVLAATLGGGDGDAAASASALHAALIFGLLGLLAATVKAAGGVVAAHGQAKIASRVAGVLRLQVLDGWFARYRLRRPRQFDHGQRGTTPPSQDASIPGVTSGGEAHGVSALTARVAEVESGLSQGLLGGGRALAQLGPLLAALFWISPRLALAALGVLLPFSLILSSTRRLWRRAYVASARDGEDLLRAADEAVRHADLWVSYSAEPRARATVEMLGESLGRRAARIHASSAAMSGGNEVLAAAALVAALGAAQAGWLGDVGGGGRLLAFTVCFFLAYRPIRDLTEARLAWSRALVAFGALGQESPDLPEGMLPPVRPAWPVSDLHVDHIVLAHGVSAPLSFVVPAGEVVAVVGATGEGKTTLLRTLLGLEAPRGGELRYGDLRLTDAPPGLQCRPFAWVPQDSALLADTLAANVCLGAPDGAVDVRAVLGSLGAGTLAELSPGCPIGAGGRGVSGGERQWIALARALATGQPVLLLDEPTSGLDPSSQRAVLEALAALRGLRSVIVVTHRPEPLGLADVVVRLEGGSVRVEELATSWKPR